eukprot:NODE_35_length_36362_cov_0.944434.p18 type:complete len:277 gc:universal NODE_35_length_36362_cov_0.944434:14157-14987(+)
MIFQNIDWSHYIYFGIAINANLQGLIMSPLLLMKDFKRNWFIVISNILYFIGNWVSFFGNSIDCDTAMYVVQLTIITGSIFEVHTPLVRAYKLLEGKLKRSIPILSGSLIICIFCSLAGIHSMCYTSSSHFVKIFVSIVPDLIASIFSISIYLISFWKIIELIDSSEFGKDNPKMQMIRAIAKFSMYFMVLVRCCMIGFSIGGLDTNQKLSTALRTNLVVFLMIVQLTLELTKSSGETSERSDVESVGKRRNTRDDFKDNNKQSVKPTQSFAIMHE